MLQNYQGLGKEIRKYRNQKKITTAELAKRLGVSVGLISNIENARNDVFRLELLMGLSKELEIPPQELLKLDSVGIESTTLGEEADIILGSLESESRGKVHLIRYYLNQIMTSFLKVVSQTKWKRRDIEMISKHIVQEIEFFGSFTAKHGKEI